MRIMRMSGSMGEFLSPMLAELSIPTLPLDVGAPLQVRLTMELRPEAALTCLDYFSVQRFNQVSTVSCHCRLFCGFCTKWVSSGKVSSSLGMPRRCSAVKAPKP